MRIVVLSIILACITLVGFAEPPKELKKVKKALRLKKVRQKRAKEQSLKNSENIDIIHRHHLKRLITKVDKEEISM